MKPTKNSYTAMEQDRDIAKKSTLQPLTEYSMAIGNNNIVGDNNIVINSDFHSLSIIDTLQRLLSSAQEESLRLIAIIEALTEKLHNRRELV